jgi:hypothetical protein
MLMLASGPASAALIDFEGLPLGPNGTNGVFGDPMNNFSIFVPGEKVDFTGGVLLNHTTNLPADQTEVYGTAGPNTFYLNPLLINFSAPVHDVSFLLLNGMTVNQSYTTRDGLGDLVTLTLAPNLSNGSQTVSFTGNIGNLVLVASDSTSWDFFIDNLQFTPNPKHCPVPEPGTLMLLGSGMVGLVIAGRKKFRR